MPFQAKASQRALWLLENLEQQYKKSCTSTLEEELCWEICLVEVWKWVEWEAENIRKWVFMRKLFQNGKSQNLPSSLAGSLSSLILLERSARCMGQSQRTRFLQHIHSDLSLYPDIEVASRNLCKNITSIQSTDNFKVNIWLTNLLQVHFYTWEGRKGPVVRISLLCIELSSAQIPS